MPATARWCERSAHASISSRVTPASTAAFQPTVIDMSMFGAFGRSRWVGENQSSQSSVPGARRVDRGDVDDDWTPPATTTRSMPARTVAAAVVTAARPGGAVPVVGQPGDVVEPGLDGGVAGDVAPAVERLAEHDVVDQSRVDAGPADGLGDRPGAELERVDVDERALEGRADRGARRGHDDRVSHRESPLLSPGHPAGPGSERLCPPSL